MIKYAVDTKKAKIDSLLFGSIFNTRQEAKKWLDDAMFDYPDHEPLVIYKLTIKRERVK